jgi:tetratricopeptide (TPR) repeat protein
MKMMTDLEEKVEGLLPFEQIDLLSEEYHIAEKNDIVTDEAKLSYLNGRLKELWVERHFWEKKYDEGVVLFKEGNYAAAIPILENYRKNTGSYVSGDDSRFGISIKDHIAWLDPVGHAYETLGLADEAKTSRVMNAKLLAYEPHGHYNYCSAARLYKAAGEFLLAYESYERWFKDTTAGHSQGMDALIKKEQDEVLALMK